jgi:phage tail-like protein
MPSPAEPHSNHRFRVEIDGIASLDFAEVALPEACAEVVEYREGGDRRTRKIPGAVKFSNLTLRRGVTQSSALFDWWASTADGAPDRRNVSIVLLDEQLQPVKQWKISGAWPARYLLAPLIANGEAAALIETLECAVEDFRAG